MTDKPDGKRWAWWTWASILIAALVVYVAIAPPVIWLELHVTPKVFQEIPIYAPIQWILDHGPDPARRAIQWYFRLWNL